MRINKYLKLNILILISIILVAAPVQAQEVATNAGFHPQELLRNALQWVDNLGAVAPLVFILIYVIATVAFLPGSVLTLGAGVLFGVIQGSIYVFIGATLGETIAFLLGRYLLRGLISKKIASHQKFQAIDQAIGKEGFKIVLLTRLSPIFPFNLLNYGLGVTGVSLKDYVLGSVGIIPGTIMYVYIGSLAGSIATIGSESQPDANPIAQWTIRIIGFIATVAVTLYITKIARKALDESINPGEEQQA
ncbi:MAG: TVP38/TMEM64 family protein [Waterburya sp.]